MAASAPTSDQLAFFRTVFARKSPTDKILVSIHYPEPKNPRVRETLYCDTPDEAAIAAAEFSIGWHVFYGIVPRSSDGRSRKDTSPNWVAFWIDLDKPFDEARIALQRLLLPPTAVIRSGVHLQAIWCLSNSPESIEYGEKAVEKIHNLLGAVGSESSDGPRLLRVPDTQHVKDKDHPLWCRLDSLDPERVYTVADLVAAASVPNYVRSMVLEGKLEGRKTRSERDFQAIKALRKAGMSVQTVLAVVTHPDYLISQKQDEHSDPAHYLAHTVQSVEQELQADSVEVPTVFEMRNEGIYYDGVQVGSFTLEPTRLIEGEDGHAIVCSVTVGGRTYHNHVIKKSAFRDDNTLVAALPFMGCQWIGSKTVTRKFELWLFRRATQLGVSLATGVDVTGLHGPYYMSANQIIGERGMVAAQDCEYLLVEASYSPAVYHHSAWEPSTDAQFRPFLQQFVPLLQRLNQPDVVLPYLGWYMASPLRPLFRQATEGFPILNPYGTRGSGKTSTTRLFQRLFALRSHAPDEYGNHDFSTTVKTTGFAAMRSMSSTNALPTWLTEYREYEHARAAPLYQHLRSNWDGLSDTRGKRDLSVQRYRLAAPTQLEGEDPLEDSALKERVIRVAMSPQTVDRGTEANAVFEQLHDLPLELFGYHYLMFALRNRHEVKPLYTANQKLVQRAIERRVPNRTMIAMAIVTTGLQLFSKFVGEWGVTFAVTEGVVFRAFAPMLNELLGDNTRVATFADSFVEDIINAVATARAASIPPPFTYEYVPAVENSQPRFWYAFPSAFAWWQGEMKRRDRDAITRRSLKRQLHELEAEYTEPHMTRRIRQIPFAMDGIRMRDAYRCGLDIPEDFGPDRAQETVYVNHTSMRGG